MGTARHRRGSRVIRESIDREQRPDVFRVMDRINALPKVTPEGLCLHAVPSFETGAIYCEGSTWFFADAADPYGSCRWYSSLEQLVRSWDVSLVGYDLTTGFWTTHNNPRS